MLLYNFQVRFLVKDNDYDSNRHAPNADIGLDITGTEIILEAEAFVRTTGTGWAHASAYGFSTLSPPQEDVFSFKPRWPAE